MKLRRKVAKGSAYETSAMVFLGRPLFWFKAGKKMAENLTDHSHKQPMDARAIARRLGVSVFTVKREVKRGALGFYRVGSGKGRLRFTEEQLEKYLAGRENIDRAEATQKSEGRATNERTIQ
jgi:excisionase family DNA binding protein